MKRFENAVIGVHIFLAVLIVALIVFMVAPTFFGWGEGAMEIYKFPIVSIEKNTDLHGKFFLGCGSVDSERIYYTYAVMPDGGYRLLTMKAAATTIYETDDVAPHIMIAQNYSRDINWMLMVLGKYWWDIKLWVPEGTIVKEFRPL